jgi:hypothetical protein
MKNILGHKAGRREQHDALHHTDGQHYRLWAALANIDPTADNTLEIGYAKNLLSKCIWH